MEFERNPNPLRKVIDLDPVAEDRLILFIDEFKEKARKEIENDAVANENVKKAFLDSLELLNPTTILASLVDNHNNMYAGKSIEEQFKLWMDHHFIHKELTDLKEDTYDDPGREKEAGMMAGLTFKLEPLVTQAVSRAKSE